MSILEYIKKYGNKTFAEEKFNEVDSAIFSSISYIDFQDILSSSLGRKKKLKDAAEEYLKKTAATKNKITAYKTAIIILKKIMHTKRYGDSYLYNYYYIGNEEQQFSALTVEIDSKLIFIAYEGTDSLVSGWEEDFQMSYMFPVKAQRNAINYINKFIFNRKNIIIGGHSKGGNLALVAAMYANRFTKRKIIAVYNNDGPGLRKKEFMSREYREVALKLHTVIPSTSIVGFLYRHSNKYKVIKSSKKGAFAHDIISWEVEDNHFIETDISKMSKIFDKSMSDWLKKYNDAEREVFTKSLFDVFRRAGIKDLEEVMTKKTKIIRLIVETRGISKTTKKMMREFITIIFAYYKDASK